MDSILLMLSGSMNQLHHALKGINAYLWGPLMLVVLFGTHIFFTIRLRFIQRYTLTGIKLSIKKETGAQGDVSPFGALATALAATIGTGNIVGVATAIASGGPGAVLWCWLTGVFGMATKYSEAILAVKYRVKTPSGMMLGGPMYALEHGLGQKWLAVLFCLFTSLAAFGIGNMVQANSISTMLAHSFGLDLTITGAVMAMLVAFVVLGGIRTIARVCEFLVPFMAIFYIIGCLVILAVHHATVIPALKLILKSAFTPQAAAGGFIGSTIREAARFGIARGLFSNESGLGSAPIVAAAAQTRNPVRQALISYTGTFWDTVVVCAITGVTLVSVIIAAPDGYAGHNGAKLTALAFDHVPVVGPTVLAVGLLTFVFSTILGWSYYGEKAFEYLFGTRSIIVYRLAWITAVFLGSVTTMPLVWELADTMNMLMAIPNLIALLLLNGVIVSETRKYLWSHRLEEAMPEPGPAPDRKNNDR